MEETDAQKKEIEKNEEELEDLTPEKDAMGGARRQADGLNPGLDAQKKEISDT